MCLGRGYDIAYDWQSVVNYVRNHSYDNTGLLQIGFRKNEGGHAINFLRYENAKGQDRLYAYDNNFPDRETYFYKDGYGRVMQAPLQTFDGSIDCIALRNVRTYFSSVKSFDATHVIYVAKDAATVQGFSYTYMEGDVGDIEYVMYEIPADRDRVTIVPKKDHADFLYMGTEYSFGEVTEATRGELRFATDSDETAGSNASFTIYEVDSPKKANPLSVNAKKATVSVSLATLKTKAVILVSNVTVSKAKGVVSYANASNNATAKKFKVNAKTGKLTVPKGTKKGTYAVKIKVTAKGDKTFSKGTKTVSYKIQVK